MYDEGTISNTEPLTTLHETHAINDLVYARRYFTSSAYLRVNGQPALFVFPYSQVDPNINWSHVRSQLGITVTLLDEDPNPGDQQHDLQFDGFYAWVQPPASGWRDDGSEWGHDYLTWFYNVMAGLAPTYTSRVAVGGVWPGFDDSTAPWGQNRYMWRRCGQTWQDTWQLAHQYNPPYVMIDTWNDFEEGSDIEFGIGECQLHAQQQKTLAGRTLVFTNLLSNTGKFSDSFTLSGNSSHGWPIAITPTSTLLLSHTGIVLTLALTVPVTAPSGIQDLFTITATSHLSPSVYSRLVNTATVLWGNYLPVIRRD